jgi:uncharacterized membrane protein YpjA
MNELKQKRTNLIFAYFFFSVIYWIPHKNYSENLMRAFFPLTFKPDRTTILLIILRACISQFLLNKKRVKLQKRAFYNLTLHGLYTVCMWVNSEYRQPSFLGLEEAEKK